MGKVTKVQETKQDAQPQTRSQIRSSSLAETAVHGSSSSTSALLAKQEVRPEVDVASEYPDGL